MDIYHALSKDHRHFEALLKSLVISSKADGEKWKTVLDELRRDVTAHAHAEEAVFYNALRETEASKSLVLHSYAEHMTAEGELRALTAAKALDANWTTMMEKFSKDLRHHIKTEETEIYDAARQVLSAAEARQLGVAFERMKLETMKDGDSMVASAVDLIVNLLPPRLTERFRKSATTRRVS